MKNSVETIVLILGIVAIILGITGAWLYGGLQAQAEQQAWLLACLEANGQPILGTGVRVCIR